MGGKVLEYEAKTILQQGLQAGELKKAKQTAKNLRTLGMDDDTIAKMIDVEVALVREWSLKE